MRGTGPRRRGLPSGGAPRSLAAAALLLLGCGTPGPAPLRVEDALLDPSPSRRTDAVVRIASTGDRSRIPDLIELLDDPDPAVRMTAGGALRELTGRDSGYAPWADGPERRRQVEEWRAWWRREGGGS